MLMKRKLFQLVIDENLVVVTLIETFYEGTMYNGHVKVASLVYIYKYM